VKTRRVFLHLRSGSLPSSPTLLVLEVRSFDFFRLGLTEVHSTAPGIAHLKGRQYQSLGQAAQELQAELFGRDSGYCDYMREYVAYCISSFSGAWDAHLGKGTRNVVLRGERFESSFSPGLLNTYVELAPDSLVPGGRWVAAGDLLPLVQVSVPDASATARLDAELAQNHHNPTVGSRNRPQKRAATSSSTHADQSGSRRDDRGDGRIAPADERFRAPANEPAPAAAERLPKRARFSTKEGLCVYRTEEDTDTPHEILATHLVEQAMAGSSSMKMLTLRPLHPPGAEALVVPYLRAVSLHERFKAVWRQSWYPERGGSTWVTARTQCSESDGALYDAHIRAVKLQAKTTGKTEVDLFHNLCWGYGKVALGRYPPELDGADAANLA